MNKLINGQKFGGFFGERLTSFPEYYLEDVWFSPESFDRSLTSRGTGSVNFLEAVEYAGLPEISLFRYQCGASENPFVLFFIVLACFDFCFVLLKTIQKSLLKILLKSLPKTLLKILLKTLLKTLLKILLKTPLDYNKSGHIIFFSRLENVVCGKTKVDQRQKKLWENSVDIHPTNGNGFMRAKFFFGGKCVFFVFLFFFES